MRKLYYMIVISAAKVLLFFELRKKVRLKSVKSKYVNMSKNAFWSPRRRYMR